MSAWRRVPLADLTEPVRSWNPARSAPSSEFDYIDLTAVDQEEKLIVGPRRLPCSEAPSRARQLVACGDVLVSTVRPILNGVARVPQQLSGATASTGFCVLRARPPVLESGYLFHWVKSPAFVGDMVRRAAGASYPAVSDRIVSESQIPLAPLAEQRRIAEVLDRADALRAKRRAAIAQLDTLTQSIFLDLFGDPATNPRDWPVQTIADLCLVRGGKRLPKGEEYSPVPTPFRYVRVVDITDGCVSETNLCYLRPDVQAKIARYTVDEGDVIISIAGSIGLVAPVSVSLAGANLTENAAKLVPRDRTRHIAIFLAESLRMPHAQQQISSHVGQVTIGKLALFRVEKLRLPVPPLALQRTFATHVAAVERLKAAHRASLAKLDELFASLQHRAFRGEL